MLVAVKNYAKLKTMLVQSVIFDACRVSGGGLSYFMRYPDSSLSTSSVLATCSTTLQNRVLSSSMASINALASRARFRFVTGSNGVTERQIFND